MQIATTIAQARALFDAFAQTPRIRSDDWRARRGTSLARASVRKPTLFPSVAASLFVNPMQFAPGEDLAKYPRDFESDQREIRTQAGVDVLFAPDPARDVSARISECIHVGAIGSAVRGCDSSGSLPRRGDRRRQTAEDRLPPEVLYVGQKDASRAPFCARWFADLDFPVRVEIVEDRARGRRTSALEPQRLLERGA